MYLNALFPACRKQSGRFRALLLGLSAARQARKRKAQAKIKRGCLTFETAPSIGGSYKIRTCDPLLVRQVL